MSTLLARKVGMTRVFQEDGTAVPVTVLEAGPCTVVARKTTDSDGYEAVQAGYTELSEKRCNKPMTGHFKKAGVSPKRRLYEFRVNADNELKPGDELTAALFEAGDRVDITGKTKGKGFQGVIKRHGMGGGPGGHGSHFHRAPGSVGQSADPSKIYKGKRMPGRMGNGRRTMQNLEVIQVDPEKKLLVVRGCIPGPKGGVIEVRKSVKVRRAQEAAK